MLSAAVRKPKLSLINYCFAFPLPYVDANILKNLWEVLKVLIFYISCHYLRGSVVKSKLKSSVSESLWAIRADYLDVILVVARICFSVIVGWEASKI